MATLHTHTPDPHQRLLVTAALGQAGAADAWRAWCATADRPQLDESSIRLLPLVHWALTRHDPSLPWSEHVSVLHRQTWLRNQRLLLGARRAIRTLQGAGHDVMVVKGVALILRYYGDAGARTLGDADLVTNDPLGTQALTALEASGWRYFSAARPAAYVMERSEGVGLVDGRGGKVDLHRRIPHVKNGDDAAMWARCAVVAIDDLRVHTLATPDELLLTLSQGWQWDRIPSFRWIPDAVVLVADMTESDWSVFVAEVRARNLVVKTTNALGYLAAEFGVDVPALVTRELTRAPVARYEGAEERAELRPTSSRSPWSKAYFQYARSHPGPAGPLWWCGFAIALARRTAPPPGTTWLRHVTRLVRRSRFRRRTG